MGRGKGRGETRMSNGERRTESQELPLIPHSAFRIPHLDGRCVDTHDEAELQ